MVIKNNPILSDISAINNIETVTDYMNIQENINLSDCAIDLICTRLETNNISVQYNGQDCSAIEDVYLNCN